MAGSGPDLDSWTAQFQTHDMQRDAPVRLGACAIFAAAGVGLLLNNFYDVGIPMGVVLIGAVLVGVLTGGWAARRSARISAQISNENRAERAAEADRRIEEARKSGAFDRFTGTAE